MKKLLIAVAILISVQLFIYFTNDIDATSSATPKRNKSQLKLPEKSENYQIFVVDGLDNFTVQYDNNFSRGGQITTVEGIKQLKKWGFETVITITPTDQERALAKQFGIKLIELEFSYQGLTHQIINRFLKELENSGKIYAHCHGGTHRAGILGVLYRIFKNDKSFDEAINEFYALGGFPKKDEAMISVIRSYLEDSK